MASLATCAWALEGLPGRAWALDESAFIAGRVRIAMEDFSRAEPIAIVRQIVEAHGGTISVHGEGEGRGSEFVVRCPTLVQQ